MIPLSDQLTAQFYEWEQRGRGWLSFEQAVDLEPHFHPFFFHYAPKQTQQVDDSKRHTLFSWIGEAIKGRPAPEPEQLPFPEDPGIQGLIFECNEPLRVFSIYLPKGHKIDPEATQQLLLMLSYCKYPISFEIVGSSISISLQLACRISDATHV